MQRMIQFNKKLSSHGAIINDLLLKKHNVIFIKMVLNLIVVTEPTKQVFLG